MIDINTLLIEKIRNNSNLYCDSELIEALKCESKAQIKKTYEFLINDFDSFDESKKFDCLILLNIIFFSVKGNKPQVEDPIFLKFLIDKSVIIHKKRKKDIISQSSYFNYCLISIHLLLNRYDSYEIDLILKELDLSQKDILISLILKGLVNDDKINPNPNEYFKIIRELLNEDYINSNNLNYQNFFIKIIKDNETILKRYKSYIIDTLTEKFPEILRNENLFLLMKYFYAVNYNSEDKLFAKIDRIIIENLMQGSEISKITEFFSHFKEKEDFDSIFLRFYEFFIDTIKIMKEKNNIQDLIFFLKSINFDALKDDPQFLANLMNEIKFYAKAGGNSQINEVYENIKKIFENKPVHQIGKIKKTPKQLIEELWGENTELKQNNISSNEIFEFIKNQKIREELNQRYDDIIKLASLKMYKLGIILIGSIMEQLLKSYYNNSGKFNDLINNALKDKIISKSDHAILMMMLHLRNYIHIEEYVKYNDSVTEDKFNATFIMFKELIKKFRGFITQKN